MFIVFDGVDGTGKSTQIKLIKKWLDDEGIDYFSFREPGGSESAEMIRRVFLKTKMRPISQLLLVAAARHENMLLLDGNKDKLVLVDRFIDSTYAYQGLDIESNIIDMIMDLTVNHHPDYTFLFLYQYRQFSHNHFDELALKKKAILRKKFLERYNEEKYFLIPDNKSIDEIFILIKNKIKQLLNLD